MFFAKKTSFAVASFFLAALAADSLLADPLDRCLLVCQNADMGFSTSKKEWDHKECVEPSKKLNWEYMRKNTQKHASSLKKTDGAVWTESYSENGRQYCRCGGGLSYAKTVCYELQQVGTDIECTPRSEMKDILDPRIFFRVGDTVYQYVAIGSSDPGTARRACQNDNMDEHGAKHLNLLGEIGEADPPRPKQDGKYQPEEKAQTAPAANASTSSVK